MDKLTLGKRIAHARLHVVNGRKTQAEVAEAMGVTPQAVSGWERNEALPELEKFSQLADLLGTSLVWLLQGDPDATSHYMDELREDAAKRPTQKRHTPKPDADRDLTLPIYSTASSGNGLFVVTSEVMIFTRPPVFLIGVQGAYGFCVFDETMAPAYEIGDIVFVNPQRPPIAGADVVLYARDPRNGDAEATMRRLLTFSKKAWETKHYTPLETVNLARSQWPICHLVVGKWNAIR